MVGQLGGRVPREFIQVSYSSLLISRASILEFHKDHWCSWTVICAKPGAWYYHVCAHLIGIAVRPASRSDVCARRSRVGLVIYYSERSYTEQISGARTTWRYVIPPVSDPRFICKIGELRRHNVGSSVPKQLQDEIQLPITTGQSPSLTP